MILPEVGMLASELVVPTELTIKSDKDGSPDLTITTSGCWSATTAGVQSLSVTPEELGNYLTQNCEDWSKVRVIMKEGIFTRAMFPYDKINGISNSAAVLDGKKTRAGAVVEDVDGQPITLLFFEDEEPNPVTGNTHLHLGCVLGKLLS
jgi:hypothetical protein